MTSSNSTSLEAFHQMNHALLIYWVGNGYLPWAIVIGRLLRTGRQIIIIIFFINYASANVWIGMSPMSAFFPELDMSGDI